MMEELYLTVPNPLAGYQGGIDNMVRLFDLVRNSIVSGYLLAYIRDDGLIETMLTKDFDEVEDADLEIVGVEEFDERVEEVLRQLNFRWN